MIICMEGVHQTHNSIINETWGYHDLDLSAVPAVQSHSTALFWWDMMRPGPAFNSYTIVAWTLRTDIKKPMGYNGVNRLTKYLPTPKSWLKMEATSSPGAPLDVSPALPFSPEAKWESAAGPWGGKHYPIVSWRWVDHGRTWMSMDVIWDDIGMICDDMGLYGRQWGISFAGITKRSRSNKILKPMILQHGLMMPHDFGFLGQPSFQGDPPVIKHGNEKSHMVFPF